MGSTTDRTDGSMTPPGEAALPGLAQDAGPHQEITEALQRQAFYKVAWRVLPILIVAYILNYMDRTNIAVAALTMNQALGLTATQFGYGAGLLFVGYCALEIPSNLALYRFGARRWIARIMITWGVASAAMAFAVGPKSFYLLRFLLGAAEAGFFPGVTFYLSYWFPAKYRARITAWFMIAIPASSLIGSPLSGILLESGGHLGLAGWQWLFLVEALPCVLVGLLVLRMLPDSPAEATWLTPEDRDIIVRTLADEKSRRQRSGQVLHSFLPVLTDTRVWLITLTYLCFLMGAYAIQMWLPLMLKQAHLSNFSAATVSGIPYLFASVGMVSWAWYVDRVGQRALNVALTCLVAACGFAIALVTHDFTLSLIGLTIALIGANAARAILWAMPALYLTGAAAAGGLAFINSIGTLGGFFGPWLIGWLKDVTGSFTAGLGAMMGFLLMGAVFAMLLRWKTRGEILAR